MSALKYPHCLAPVSQLSHSVVSDSLRPHESQHARPPCPSPTPGLYSNSRPSSQWCHPAISSSVVPFPPAPHPSQHQGLFQRSNSSHEVGGVLEFQLQRQSFQAPVVISKFLSAGPLPSQSLFAPWALILLPDPSYISLLTLAHTISSTWNSIL